MLVEDDDAESTHGASVHFTDQRIIDSGENASYGTGADTVVALGGGGAAAIEPVPLVAAVLTGFWPNSHSCRQMGHEFLEATCPNHLLTHCK
jgi:hypothetical protein